MDKENNQETGLALGILIIGILLVLMLSATAVGNPKIHTIAKDPESIITGIYFQYIGILFLLSYFFSYKCFFFRWLMWICENLSSPKGSKMALFYSALAFGIGTTVLLTGLGVL